jgi:FG-GAP repeat
MRRSLVVCFAMSGGLFVAHPGQGAASGAPPAGPPTTADFDGDGFADLAVGAPREDVGAIIDAGAVNVLYGGPGGLTATGDQIWHQGIPGMEGDGPQQFDEFGTSLAAGDFDGDGFADLAVGTPLETLGTDSAAGSVNVIYGSGTGLAVQGNLSWTQGSLGLPDSDTATEPQERFGAALAAGDLGNGPEDDLAIGVPFEGIGSIQGAGAANVIYGSSSGLGQQDAEFWHQDVAGVEGDGAEMDDQFGASLAVADLGETGRDDLAVGAPFEGIGAAGPSGAVNVLYGSGAGLSTAADQFWHQDRPGVADASESGDRFGAALAAGNFGSGARADLAVGAWAETVGTADDAGAVNVLYGSADGLTATDDQFWHQDKAGVAGNGAQQADLFGVSLAAGDLGRDERADLAIGVRNEDVPGTMDVGAVNILYGGAEGLNTAGDQFWHQDKEGMAGGGAEANDDFGLAVAVADFGRSGRADLAVGAPGEDVGSLGNAGAANVLYGSADGLTTVGDQFWHQGKEGIVGEGAEENDMFGWAVTGMA